MVYVFQTLKIVRLRVSVYQTIQGSIVLRVNILNQLKTFFWGVFRSFKIYYSLINLNIAISTCSLSCNNGGTCQVISGIQQCVCPCLFSGSNCEIYNNPCASNLCLNGGSCVTNLSACSYSCQCPYGLTGTYCQLGMNKKTH